MMLPRGCPLTRHEDWCHILVSGKLQESGVSVHTVTCLTGTPTAHEEIVHVFYSGAGSRQGV